MTYKVEFTKSAFEELQAFPSVVAKRLLSKIRGLSDEENPSNVKSMIGYPGYYRLRVGDYRAVFLRDDTNRLVKIVKIGHRKEVYRVL